MRLAMATVIAAALLGTALRAQSPSGELRIVVTDRSGLGVIATGTLSSTATSTRREFTTDRFGRFVFERLPSGTYRLTVAAAGFSAYDELIDLASSLARDVRVTLDVAPVTASVTVTDAATLLDPHRTGVTYSIGALDVSEQQSPVPGRELLGLVDMQPGWLVEANGVLHPRGSEYQTLFVIDGVPTDDNRSPGFAPELPDADVEAIMVLTGTFPAEYGRKLSGVVDVTTAKDLRTGLHGTIEPGAGSFGTASGFAAGGYGWQHAAITGHANVSRTGRYLDPPNQGDVDNPGFLRAGGLSFEHHPTDRDRLFAAWRRGRATFQVPNDLVQEAAGQRQDRRTEETTGQVSWSRLFADRVVFNARLFGTNRGAALWSNQEAIPIVVSQDRTFSRVYGAASVAFQADRHELKIGGDALNAPVDEALEYRISDEGAFDPDTPLRFSFADHRDDSEQALFVQDTIRWDRVTMSAGLRWDRYRFLVRDTALSPRLGISWYSPRHDLVLRASYDRAFQTPAMENLVLASSAQVDPLSSNVLRLPVPPSRGDFVEGGVSLALARTARLDASVYRRSTSHFADDDVFLNTGVSFPIAFDSADIRGLDVRLATIERRHVSVSAAYALMKGEARLPVTGGLLLGAEADTALTATDTIAISQDQRHTVRGRVRYQLHPRAWTAVVVRAGSGLPVEIDDGSPRETLAEHYGPAIVEQVDFEAGRVKPNVALDVDAGVELWRRDRRRLQVRVNVSNLTNRLNVINFAGLFSGTAVSAPRSVNVRARVEF